jgi:ribose transport system substrate-binding protein
MKIQLSTGIALALAVAFLAAGCGNKQDEPATGPDKGSATGDKKETIVWKKPTLQITMIAKSQNNPVFPTARVGADKAAEELSAKTGVKITVEWLTPNEEDAVEQGKRLQQAVAQGTDVALMSLSDATKVTSAIDAAVAKDVPVMTFDSDAPNSKRFAFYGVDDAESGAKVMAELAEQTGKACNYAVLAGNQNAPNLQNRVKGALEEAKKYPNMKYVGTFYHAESPQEAAKEVKRVMQANPSINAWCMVGGWPLFTTSLLDLDPKKVKIVAIDCLPAQLEYINTGIAPVLLAQPTYNWGYESVKIIVDKLVYGKDVPVINKMELVRVSKENLNEWAKKLKSWGLPGIDPKFLK